MTVQPWEPVSWWIVPEEGHPLGCDVDFDLGFYPETYNDILRSDVLAEGGACRVTLANGQKIIVRAKR